MESKLIELKMLREQKRQIDQRIKELTQKEYRYGNVKFGLQTYSTSRLDEYFLSVNSLTGGEPDLPRRWRRIVTSNNKQTAIDHIDTLISDLKGLREIMKGDSDDV